ncbi:serine protease [Harenicola maris]
MRLFFVATVAFATGLISGGAARAQATAWVQIEAQPTLAEAEARARAYAATFPQVSGFRMRSGWYAIALGPFARNEATNQLRSLRSARQIPGDSFVAFSNQYAQQFWPVGGAIPTQPLVPLNPAGTTETAQPAPDAGAQAEETAEAEAEVVATPEPEPEPEETPRQARASERQLDRAGRELLQEALQWEGFYTGAIDASFGAGTRRAMAAYQTAIGAEPTGVLTTRQREGLIGGYQAQFEALGLASLRDERAGVELIAPTKLVKFAKIEPPFAQYDSEGDSGVRLLLISQLGEQAELSGLYDIMQTLEIVPPEGERERGRRSFTLTGQDTQRHSYTYATLSGGQIKGFTLIWRPEDAKLMTKVVQMMRDSFTPLDGVVMPDNAGTSGGDEQRIDLMAGLQLRRPDHSRSGFYVDGSGAVLTTTEALGQCSRVTVNEEVEMEVSAQDDSLGLALLRPQSAQAPLSYARFAPQVPRLQSEIAVSGYSYEDLLTLPVLTFGQLADIRGLSGQENLHRLSIEALPGDAGGPVLDQTGAVVGMLLPRSTDGARQLPENVSFSADAGSIAAFLSNAGLTPSASEATSGLPPEDLTLLAGDMTVLVSCWN